ncbi:MAG: ABC transporter permease, partial [Burkholderiaceae bacterium]
MSTPTLAPGATRARASGRDSAMRRGLRRPRTLIGLGIVALCVILGLLAPVLSPHSPLDQSFGAFQKLSWSHPLGTDELGRDLMARVLYGIRVDVVVAVFAIPIGALVGCTLGMLSANESWYGALLQRIFDLMLAFTALVMGMLIAALIGTGTVAVIVTVALVSVPLFGRITRSAVMTQLGRDYAVAAQVLGVSRSRLMLRHILPNSVDALIVQAALSFSMAVFIEGAMSFVGIGVRPPNPS